MDVLKFHWQLLNGLYRMKEKSEQVMQLFCAPRGITPLHLRVMITLYYTGPQTMSALARKTCIAGTNNSVLCKKLAGMGYLSRNRDPEDERQVLVELTPEGDALVRQFGAECVEAYGAWSGELSEQDREIVIKGLDKLNEMMDINAANEEAME